ncbi:MULTISPECIES: DUF3365 domain-containing protein [Sulfurimonas]|uniref:DUF3365 domain-containing protein n=1 Tax=Sulfurimonas diazotrophicus TaxID=3131939 RepID=A0ABZ3HDI8_9BACT
MKKILLTTTLLATALFANPYESTPEEIAAVKATGQKTAAALLKSLGGNLQKHLKSGGPMEAFGFCSDHAYTLTEVIDQSMGSDVSVKRISLQYRNPANAPQGSEKAILESLQTLQANGVVLPEDVVEVVGDGVYKYYKPLLINKAACLKCHGDIDKLPELAKAIRERYPEDKATGYRMNDLRGAVVVTVKH